MVRVVVLLLVTVAATAVLAWGLGAAAAPWLPVAAVPWVAGVTAIAAVGAPGLWMASRVLRAAGERVTHRATWTAATLAVWSVLLVAVPVVALRGGLVDLLADDGAWPVPAEHRPTVQPWLDAMAQYAGAASQATGGAGPDEAGVDAPTDGEAPEADAPGATAAVAPPADAADPSLMVPAESPVALPAPPPAPEPLRPADLFARSADAVVVVHVRTPPPDGQLGELVQRMGIDAPGHGSGFAVEGGWIVTNHHVIANATSARVEARDGRTADRVEVVAVDADHDLALLKVDLDLPTVPLADAGAVAVGDQAYAIGSPLGWDHTLTEGLISAVRTWQGTRVVQMQTPIAPGSSGGPLFDELGRVVAVNTAVAGEDIHLAVRIGHVHALLAAPRYPKALDTWTPDLVVTDLKVSGMDAGPVDRATLESAIERMGRILQACLVEGDTVDRLELDIGSGDVAGLQGTGCEDGALEVITGFLGMLITAPALEVGATLEGVRIGEVTLPPIPVTLARAAG